jgi:tRNA pseudouridine13 synthase
MSDEKALRVPERVCRTAHMGGVGGVYKSRPEDFVVEEVPAYEPSGEGEHVYLWVECVGASTPWAVKRIARAFGVKPRDVGVAGFKDRVAVTRQWVSLPGRGIEPGEVVGEVCEGVTVLSASRHRNKLKRGHLKGNRFELVVREVDEGALERARAIMSELEEGGAPNYYGEQRFGREGETLRMGLGVIRGTERVGDRKLRRLCVNAVQSALFNDALAARVRAGTLGVVEAGDVMGLRGSGGVFRVEEDEVEETQRRLDEGELVVTGPMFGPKMIRPAGEVDAREEGFLAARGVGREEFDGLGSMAPGGRRPYVVYPQEVSLEGEEGALRMRFFLPSGAYATVMLEELMRGTETL